MSARIAIVALLSLSFSGCFKPSRTIFVDVPQNEAKQMLKIVTAKGDLLKLTVVQEELPPCLASIQAHLIEGNIYLKPLYISSMVRETEFTVDLSGSDIPSNWRDHLYWIESESISSPVNPTIEHVREIHRSRILVE